MEEASINEVPLFAGLRRKDRKQVAQWADEIEIAEGTELVTQGSFAHEFFVIEEGSAAVTDGGVQIAELGPGDFFGEVALLSAERRTATVTANSPMRLIVMFSQQFRTMAHEMPDVADELHGAIRARWEGAS